tara:strand:+ start:54 stop:680 length:627 start_codon:yes stop_codon:yes gene_type:complete
MRQKILPSIMAESQKDMNALFKKLEGVVTYLHLDVADGKFVPSHSLDFPLRLSSKFSYNAHLMMQNPKEWIEKYGNKMDVCIPQVEVIDDVPGYISWMKERKLKVGLALKPETPVSSVQEYLQDVDTVLILTVHPGYYGAKYLRGPLRKIQQIKKVNPNIEVIVDGGMQPGTIKSAADAGADYFVSGSYVTKSENPKKAIKTLLTALR